MTNAQQARKHTSLSCLLNFWAAFTNLKNNRMYIGALKGLVSDKALWV